MKNFGILEFKTFLLLYMARNIDPVVVNTRQYMVIVPKKVVKQKLVCCRAAEPLIKRWIKKVQQGLIHLGIDQCFVKKEDAGIESTEP